MANFEPKWDLIADTNIIQEGQTTYFRLRITKSLSTSPSTEYKLEDDEHLEIEFNIISTGETYEERDFNVLIGESTSTLIPIGQAGTGSSSIAGNHLLKLNKKIFNLSSTSYIDALFFKIECPEDGTWDGPESLTFNIDSVNVITLIDEQVANVSQSGILGTTTQSIRNNTVNEIWVTPNLTTHGNNLYTIGSIGYGAESRLFIQAFGNSQTINGVTNVFMPAYEMQNISFSELPNENITDSGTILIPGSGSTPSIPDYPVTLGTNTNKINSFYMKNVSNTLNGAGCIIQGNTLSDHDNNNYYYFSLRIYASALGTPLRIMCPSECSDIYVATAGALNSGSITSTIYDIHENVIQSSNYVGRCDINGNLQHEPKIISILPNQSTTQTIIYVRIKVQNNTCPPWVSFIINQTGNFSVKSSNTLDNLIYTYKSTNKMNAIELDNIIRSSSAGSGYTFAYNANNSRNQVTNNIEPVNVPKLEENPIMILDTLENVIQTGLRFNANGQIVQTLLYNSEPIDTYFKAKIVSLKSFYNNESDAYYLGKRFRAYQTWICPSDVSNFSTAPIPGHLYQLKDTRVYPYVINEVQVEGSTKLLFEEDKWYDLGLFNESLGSTMINKERIFRIVMNDDTGSELIFDTDSNLGEIHVGEYFGHTVYPKIVVTGSELISYEIDHESSPDNILKYGLDLTADGYMVGTAYAMSSDFTSNDDIPLEFDIIATGKNGKKLTKRFNIRIVRGFGQNYITADIQPSLTLERTWFNMISSNSYSKALYYRETDKRYGIRKVPRILLKENFVNPTFDWLGIKQTVTNLRKGIINTTSGASTPNSSFRLVMGNYKIRSALDNAGNVLYDVLYRELHPEGTQVDLSLNPLVYSGNTNSTISEIYGLRQNIFNIVGEDTINLLTDPTDLSNRGVVVNAINGLSQEMLDTVPRYMNHPYVENNITSMYLPCIVVAYLEPGQGEALFNTLVRNNEHGILLNYEFEVVGVEFNYHVQDNKNYVQENFTASLKVANLFQ